MYRWIRKYQKHDMQVIEKVGTNKRQVQTQKRDILIF